MENKKKFFKAKLNDTKKIISFNNSFKDLLFNLEHSFKINLTPLESSYYNISYLDEEEDNICIENGFDFQEALKFGEISNQNYLTFILLPKLNMTLKKDQKDNFEFLEEASNKCLLLKSSLQNDFLIPKKEKKKFKQNYLQ